VPYIIAEAGVNHEGSIDLARRLIDEAKDGGANAIKFQTYRANTLASKHSPPYWNRNNESTDSQYKLFQKYDKFWRDEFQILKEHCVQVDIDFMSTPFDLESADFLNDMVNVFKVSSSDITNKPFIEYLCAFGKPIILSTGASYLHEVQEAVQWIDAKEAPVALLHCILNYPTDNENAHLGMIKDLQLKFPDKIIGYSDHTLPGNMKVLEMATMLGASILEKHFTHDKTLSGNDHYHSMDKGDLKRFKENLKQMLIILGDQNKYSLPSESPAREYARRSLVATRDIPINNAVSTADLTWKRPGQGISPKHIEKVTGKLAVKEIVEDEVIQWNMLS
jgi:N-acetylneuraminate synthase